MANAKKESAQPLISHSSILILSIFLIGLVSGQALEPDVRLYGFCAGAAGMVIYFLLDVLKTQRIQRARRRAVKRLSGRLDRHVPRCPPARWLNASRPHVNSDGQFVPIALRSRASYRRHRDMIRS